MVEKIQIKTSLNRDVTIFTAHIVSVINIDDEHGKEPFKTSIKTSSQEAVYLTEMPYQEVISLING